MKIVNVLGNYRHVVIILQRGDCKVCGIRFHSCELAAALVVEIQDKGRIPVPSFKSSDVLDIVIVPQAIGIPERADAAFRTYTGSGQHSYLLLLHVFYFIQ